MLVTESHPNSSQHYSHALVQILQFLNNNAYHFTTITPVSHQRLLDCRRGEWAKNLTDVFGWNLPFQADILPAYFFSLLHDQQLIQPFKKGWLSQIRVSSLNDLLFIHSSFPTTQVDSVFFGPDTYRFIYALNQYLANQPKINRAVEICCGASPAALTIAKNYKNAEILAIDINSQALFFSQANATAADLSNVKPIQSNLFDQVEGQFDLITANPPYLMDVSQRAYRHGGDLMGAELSLKIFKSSLPRLTVHGALLLYTGVTIIDSEDHFRDAIAEYMKGEPSFQWEYREIDPDIFGEELEQRGYEHVERIAAVVVIIKRLK